MAEKFKVYNERPYDIGVILLSGQNINIKSGSFALLSEDDISFIESQCVYNKKLFGTGKLRIDHLTEEKADAIGIVKSEENLYIPTEEIEKKLLGNAANMKKWLATIEDKAYLAEIYTIAKALDLSTSKMKVLKELLPELLTTKE